MGLVEGGEVQDSAHGRQVVGAGAVPIAEGVVPGLMSLTRTVPASVPSLFHSSLPLTPSSAEKNSVPPTAVRSSMSEPEPPGSMSLTRTVPAAVPSLFHSSSPCSPSLARKNSVPPTAVRRNGLEPNGIAVRSCPG